MANQSATSKYVPNGVNGGHHFVTHATVPGAIANTETFTVTLPDGCPKDAVPAGAPQVYSLSGDVYTRDADLPVVTTHDRSTGVTVYTAVGAVASGSILIQHYVAF